MHFLTTTILSALVLVLSATAASAAGTGRLFPRAAPTPCDQCYEDSMILVQPACANLSNIGTINEFADSKLTPQHRKCYCSLPAGNAWYLTCQTTNKCNAEMMGYAAQFTEILRTRTVCPAGSGSGSGFGSGSGSGGATVNVPASDAMSRNIAASSVGAVTAVTAVFAALL
ncbi:hypothetical protein EC957_002897 [Mortierella hygrophila]|uniref:Uncharacterized protein n=1 Tax=Mortierella hygrophila TaxID=979708 RepID=A0A9P6F2U4_9FUNG|nr:hypothetical protein EC957_002897 [Mortierella hygrophila]